MTETAASNQICEEHKQKFKVIISELEKKTFEESKKNIEYLEKKAIEINKNSSLGVSLSYFKKQFNNFFNIKKEFISDNIKQKIQIGDIECSKILRFQGSEKRNKLDDYIKKIIKESIREYEKDLYKEFGTILELFAYNLRREEIKNRKEKNLIQNEISKMNYDEYLRKINNKKIGLDEKAQSINDIIKKSYGLKS